MILAIESIRQHLQDAELDLRLVGYAADAEAHAFGADGPGAVPAAYVIPSKEVSTDLGDSERIEQLVTVTIGVLTVARNYRRGQLGDGVVGVTTLRDSVVNELIGFQPTGGLTSLRHVGGQLQRYTQEVLIWVDEFTYRTHRP